MTENCPESIIQSSSILQEAKQTTQIIKMKFAVAIALFAFVALAMAAPSEPEVEKIAEGDKPEAPAQENQPPRDKRGYVLGTYTYSEPLVYNSYPTVYRTAPVHYARTYTYPSFYTAYDSHLVL